MSGVASSFPMVPGHEITGVVTAISPKVTRYKIGENVAVGCFVDSCRYCGPCSQGLEQYCTKGNSLTSNGVERDGQTRTQGDYSNKIVVDEKYKYLRYLSIFKWIVQLLFCAQVLLCTSPLMHRK